MYDGRRRRTTEAYLSYKLIKWAFGSGELIMRQSAYLVFNPITVNNFASLCNYTPVGRASDSMMAPT